MEKTLEKIMAHNRRFVEERRYEDYAAPKRPRLKTAIVTCMDTRLLRLLPDALGIEGGDLKMIKNAGGVVTDRWGCTMRSILVAVYELDVEHILIIGHTDCGVQGMDGRHFIEMIEQRGVPHDRIELVEHCGIDLARWLGGFKDTATAVEESVKLVATHPLMPEGVSVSGYIIDTVTGELRPTAGL